MQELASAYYKVFKYNEVFFEEMKNGATNEMKDEKAKSVLHIWLNKFESMNQEVALKKKKETSLAEFRSAHNKKYQKYLKSMSGDYQMKYIGN